MVMVDLDVPKRVGKWLVAFLNLFELHFIAVYHGLSPIKKAVYFAASNWLFPGLLATNWDPK